ncbi:hypothetical protein PSHT_06040 [Puccinia striiformis]|nr:hypothetical protein PSHT_06040 [Puccinia striiformis]
MAAIWMGLLMLTSLGCQAGETFFVDTDNTTTKATIRKWKSRDLAVNKEWRIIQNLLGIRLSRGSIKGLGLHYQTLQIIPDNLSNTIVQDYAV